ncbi:MAG: transmembrane 220 family protein [Myxococcota bacterium]
MQDDAELVKIRRSDDVQGFFSGVRKMFRTVDISVRVALGVFAALFVFAAAVQLNDADPWTWVAAYGVAALLCGVVAAGVRVPVGVSVGVFAVALVWSGYLAWLVFVAGDARAMYPDETANPGLLDLEEAREMFGLLLVAVAAGLAAVRQVMGHRS